MVHIKLQHDKMRHVTAFSAQTLGVLAARNLRAHAKAVARCTALAFMYVFSLHMSKGMREGRGAAPIQGQGR